MAFARPGIGAADHRIAFGAGGDVEVQLADPDAVEDLGECLPTQPALGHVVERRAFATARIGHAPDVVEADVPLEAGAGEDVREAARRVVPLEHQDALRGVFSEQGRNAQAADARSDHDRVVLGRECAVLVCRGDHGRRPFAMPVFVTV